MTDRASSATRYPQIKKFARPADLRARLSELGSELGDHAPGAVPVDDAVDPAGPLATSFTVSDASAGDRTVGNRFAILPMEGWDATTDGKPTDLVERRWRRFGAGGAKLLWAEATAVVADGRANPNQLVMSEPNVEAIGVLRSSMVEAHRERFDTAEDLLVGIQLTHSGRWSRPTTPAPRLAHDHPLLAGRTPAGATVFTDAELDDLIDAYVAAAKRAQRAGFDFVDVKHCHGYLLHELLGAHDRPGRFGGSFDGRTRFFRTVVERLRAEAPGLGVALRLSAYDFVPFAPGDDRIGVPATTGDGAADAPYRWAFGGDGSGLGVDLTETHAMLDLCRELGVGLVSITAGSPYYNPHIQRPAYFPPSDGYLPPEDPLVGVARMLNATAELQRAHRDLAVVTGAMSYLQDWLAHVGQAVIAGGGATAIGLGRMALSYPHLPNDVLAGVEFDRRLVCRTLSDCTTAPRNGLISGCFPLDDFYKARPERIELGRIKRGLRG
ncbi:MAG: NADH:flavin oxidoreductase [Actinobacteria bacterium]|nr:NADH:flavin oxidoreductase [Actinomycetota bacterium]